MRFGTSLFAALVLAGALANASHAQATRSSAAPGYTGPYSVYGPGLTYRQDLGYTGPYSERYSSASRPAPSRTDSYSSFWTTGSITQTGKGSGQGDAATRTEAGREPASGGLLGARRPRYVRLGIAGNAIQGIVIP
jgi:hypothetical protein